MKTISFDGIERFSIESELYKDLKQKSEEFISGISDFFEKIKFEVKEYQGKNLIINHTNKEYDVRFVVLAYAQNDGMYIKKLFSIYMNTQNEKKIYFSPEYSEISIGELTECNNIDEVVECINEILKNYEFKKLLHMLNN